MANDAMANDVLMIEVFGDEDLKISLQQPWALKLHHGIAAGSAFLPLSRPEPKK
jgi:hypothetical protein